jgi:hypothetical protein
MQAGDGGEVRMLKADQGEGELENEGEEEEGGDAMEGREGVVNALPSVVGGDGDGERGGDGDDGGGDEVEVSEAFEEEK